MNHLQLFNYVQTEPDKFNYEVRAMMRTINNETDLRKMKSDLLLLLKFTQLKINDGEAMGATLSHQQALQLESGVLDD